MPVKTKEQNVQNVLEWRRRIKQHLINGFGGKCGICHYDKTTYALEFHHLDPNEKEFSFGGKQCRAWSKLVIEVEKCVLLCSNCHREVHSNITPIPSNITRFDIEKTGYKRKLENRMGVEPT